MLDSRQLAYTHQQLYHAFYQRPIHHREGMDIHGRSTNLGEKEEDTEATALNADEADVGVSEEAAQDEAQ